MVRVAPHAHEQVVAFVKLMFSPSISMRKEMTRQQVRRLADNLDMT